MSLVGYVTLAEANNYIETRYLYSDPVRENWESLSDEDKIVCLTRSMDAIESMPFTGHKTNSSQPTAFPRCPQTDVPEAVKRAQIENALSLADSSNDEDTATYDRLWRFGVNSYSIGNLSEKSADGSWGKSRVGGAQSLTSAKAYSMLVPFLQGGYSIE